MKKKNYLIQKDLALSGNVKDADLDTELRKTLPVIMLLTQMIN
jgi:hypothetical protein